MPHATRHPRLSTRRTPARTLLAALALGAAIGAPQALAAEPAGFSAGVSVHPFSSPDGLGMPVYPGAVVRREAGEEGAGADIRLWGGSLGAQLQAIKLHSPDPADRVAHWYRAALGRAGPWLDCSAAAPAPAGDRRPKDCGDEAPPSGGYLFKLAVGRDIRIVTLQPDGGGTRIQLVRVGFKGE